MSNAVSSQARGSGAPRGGPSDVASAAGILMVGLIFSRLLGLVRVALQAGVLGASGHDAAALTTAIAFPDAIFAIVSGGALASSFIPVFAGLLELGDEQEAWRVAAGVMSGILSVILVAVVLAELAAAPVVDVLARPVDRLLTLQLIRIMLLQPLFLAASGILIGLHNAYHRFVAPAIAPLVYNLATIAGLALVPVSHHDVALAAWGVSIGALLQVVVLAPGLVETGRRVGSVRPLLGLRRPGTREVGRLMVPRIIGQFGSQLSVLVAIALANLEFASRPSAALRLSFNLMSLPVGLFGGAIATAVFPTLARQAAHSDRTQLAHTVLRTLRVMIFLAVPSAVALILLRYPITQALFEHGAFRDTDVDLVATGLLWWGVGIPMLVAVELLPRVFFALKDTWTPVLVNLTLLVAAIALSVTGAHWAHHNSLTGVAVLTGAFSFTVALEVVWLVLILRRRLIGLDLSRVGLSILRALAASAAMGVGLLALLSLWPHYRPERHPGVALLLAVAVPLGLVIYAGCAYLLRVPELTEASALLRGRLRGHRSPGAHTARRAGGRPARDD